MCFSTRTLGWCCSHGGRRRRRRLVPFTWRRSPFPSGRFGGYTFFGGWECWSCRRELEDLDHKSESPSAVSAAAADEEPGASVGQRHHCLAVAVGGEWADGATPGEVQLVHLQDVVVRCVAEHCHDCQTNDIVTIRLLEIWVLQPIKKQLLSFGCWENGSGWEKKIIFLRFSWWKNWKIIWTKSRITQPIYPKQKVEHRISLPFSPFLYFLRN